MIKYSKIALSFLAISAMTVFAPSTTFALTAVSSGTSASSVSSASSGTSAGSVSSASSGSSVGSSGVSTQSSGTSVGTISSPTTSSSGTSVNSVGTPTTSTSGSSVGTISTPTTSTSGTSVGTITPPTTSSSGTSVGTTPTDNGNNGGSNNNNGGSNTSTGSSGSVSVGGGTSFGSGGSVATGGGLACQVLTQYMLVGGTYPVSEVTKLQNFLKNHENLSVAITGVYDAQTVAAVKAFQIKYSAQILAPWGATVPTGNVYLTTLKVINARACNSALTLTPAELAIINNYKAQGTETETPIVIGSTGTDSSTTTLAEGTVVNDDDTSTSSDQVATAAKISIWGIIWNFIKRIFGR